VARIRVLVVDDAVVVRRVLTEVLGAEADIEVMGVAANGRIALQKIAQSRPDVVTLDVEMPDLDGVATLRQIRATWPTLPVIMFSTLTERGAAATLDALAAGASDYVTKPANVGSVTVAMARIREELVPKVRALAASVGVSGLPPRPAVTRRADPADRPTPTRGATTDAGPERPAIAPAAGVADAGGAPEIVAIGVSTGGPNALAALLPALPADLPVPVAIVQHMPPLFTRLLAERLNAQSSLSVVEGQSGMVMQAGSVYIAPGDHHMELRRSGPSVVVGLIQTPPENSCRPAVDVLFRSVARVYGSRAVGIVLTGMGQDGLRGAEAICEAGGRVVAQDEATSVVWGMPGFVARAGLAEKVLPLEQIAADILRRLVNSRAAAKDRPASPARPIVEHRT
jgi:two-component system, chemotaxis family, protein-glutamate methylesterase/glutaminase